jgi:hypothetical protein
MASHTPRGKKIGGELSATSADTARSTGPALSPSQLRAVQHRGSDLQLIACAGSGKTETVAHRVAALIDEGISPDPSTVAFRAANRRLPRDFHVPDGRPRSIRVKSYLLCQLADGQHLACRLIHTPSP